MALPRAHADRLLAARQGRDDAKTELEAAVVAAWRAGGGIREISEATGPGGLSHTGVSKMLNRLGERRVLSVDEMDRARRERDGER